VTRAAQNLLLITLGAVMLWLTVVTTEYVNYVKDGLRLPIAASGVALVLLGAAGLRKDWRPSPDHPHAGHGGADEEGDGHHLGGHGGHHHGGRGPRVAWLLCLPVLAVFLIAPPALGSFTASRASARPQPPPAPSGEGFSALSGPDPVRMTISEYAGRSSQYDFGGSADVLQGHTVSLIGFAMPGPWGGWTLTRLRIACCAADAVPMQAVVKGVPMPKKGSWVRVTGVWTPPRKRGGNITQITAQSVQPIDKPREPYE
jgi:uncharacterized repeat protein (TIGR03943 family)